MKRFAIIILPALLSVFPWFVTPAGATGALDFDATTDLLSCGSFGFDAALDSVNSIAWVTPNFADTSATGSYIISNYTGAHESGTGFLLWWDGVAKKFVMRASNSATAFDASCSVAFGGGGEATFVAGDLVGMMFSLKDGIQACQAFTPANGNGSTGFRFDSFAYTGVAAAVNIGADAAGGNLWDGGIHQLTLMNTRPRSTNLNQVRATRKLLFYPMIPVETEAAPLYLAAWNFGRAAIGVSLAAGDVMLDVTGNGHNCTVDAGATPIGIGTEMLH